MEKKKKFTSASMPEIFYEVMGEGWMDEDTYVIVFQEMTDVDGDVFHLEVEFHKDENRVTYTRVYDYENVEASCFVTPCFKRQMEEYILKQVGKLREESMLKKQKVEVELTLDVPLDMTVGEFENWLKNDIKVSVMTPLDSKVNILKIEKK
jgi:hypothetical protein